MLKNDHAGFTLIELVIVVLIVSILTAIAVPSYTQHIAHSRRAASEACLATLANYMERLYATSLRYDQDSVGTAMTSAALNTAVPDCTSSNSTGKYYTYTLTNTQSTYQVAAAPQGAQATQDAKCGTLTIDQTGAKGKSGSGAITDCWPH